jgi:pimeloyl-ACP methyl ester carboxylesterase
MSPDITWPQVAARHAAALAQQFGEPVAVLGHSTGGSLLLQLIADHPRVVSRAVVACAAYTLGPVARDAQRRLLASVETTGRFPVEDLLDGMVRSRLLLALLRPPAAVASRLIRIENRTDVIAMLRAEDAFDVRDRLEQITTRTLVAYGGRDRFWTQEMFAETARRLPHGRAIRYPDLGHGLVTSEKFVADVVEFLQAVPQPR